jgi:hypothetical protein
VLGPEQTPLVLGGEMEDHAVMAPTTMAANAPRALNTFLDPPLLLTVAIGGTRRVRAAGSAAGAAGAGASRTRGCGRIWVGGSEGLDFERLRTSINLETDVMWFAKAVVSLAQRT